MEKVDDSEAGYVQRITANEYRLRHNGKPATCTTGTGELFHITKALPELMFGMVVLLSSDSRMPTRADSTVELRND